MIQKSPSKSSLSVSLGFFLSKSTTKVFAACKSMAIVGCYVAAKNTHPYESVIQLKANSSSTVHKL